jgi:hypothetical protein
MATRTFVVGDRIEYPLSNGRVLHGVVTNVTKKRVVFRWDGSKNHQCTVPEKLRHENKDA